MKDLTAKSLTCMVLIYTVCVIMLIMEIGIVMRSDKGDVEKSRELLAHMTDVVIGLTAGFFMGKNKSKEQ